MGGRFRMPSGGVLFWSVSGVLLGGAGIALGWSMGSLVLVAVGVVAMVSGVGLFLRRRWAKWSLIAAIAAFCVWSVCFGIVMKISWYKHVAFVLMAIGIWDLWRTPVMRSADALWEEVERILDGEEKDEEPAMLIVLRRGRRQLTRAGVARAAERAIGKPFSDDRDAERCVLGDPEDDEDPGPFFIRIGDEAYTFAQDRESLGATRDDPQVQEGAAVEQTERWGNPRYGRPLRENTSWWALRRVVPEGDTEDAYQTMGPILAELLDDDALALMIGDGEIALCRPDTKELLRGKDACASFWNDEEAIADVQLLLTGPAGLTDERIRQAGLAAANDPEDIWCEQYRENWWVAAGRYVLSVFEHPRPVYDDPRKVVGMMEDGPACEAILRHKAAVAVDIVAEGVGPVDLAEAYRVLGRFITALVGPECLAVSVVKTDFVHACDDALREKLKGPEAMGTFMHRTPLVRIEDDDPALLAAGAEARRRWGEFVKAFAEHQRDWHFAVKAPFAEAGKKGKKEFIWVEVSEIEKKSVHGCLANEPVALPSYRIGQRVTVRVKDINDWSYGEHALEFGNFTHEVLRNARQDPPVY